MNNFLRTRHEIESATKFLKDNDYVESGISCKNWEIFQIIHEMVHGDWLDMGSDGSVVLPNLVRGGIMGKKYGIDLVAPNNGPAIMDYTLVKGDLMHTPFKDEYFDVITSLSTIEHAVDFDLFAKEVSRLLRVGGKLYVSFDYWNPKPDTSKTKLYSLDWNILDESDVVRLVVAMEENKMEIGGIIDWATKDAVINDRYCSPVKGVEYTFGILSFIKANL